MILSRLSPFPSDDSNFSLATYKVSCAARLEKPGLDELSNGQKMDLEGAVVEKKQPGIPQVAEFVSVKHS